MCSPNLRQPYSPNTQVNSCAAQQRVLTRLALARLALTGPSWCSTTRVPFTPPRSPRSCTAGSLTSLGPTSLHGLRCFRRPARRTAARAKRTSPRSTSQWSLTLSLPLSLPLPLLLPLPLPLPLPYPYTPTPTPTSTPRPTSTPLPTPTLPQPLPYPYSYPAAPSPYPLPISLARWSTQQP